jgi:hypothetical protein
MKQKTLTVGDIVRIYKRTFCVLWFTETDVSLQSMDDERWLLTLPRTKLGGLKKGT